MPVVVSDTDCADLSDEPIDELLTGARTPEEIIGPDGLLSRPTKRLVERVLAAELTERLGYEHARRRRAVGSAAATSPRRHPA
jgi:transposase-like protein